jgi:hypothetical protein
MMRHLIFAIFLMFLGIAIFSWGMYNLFVEQYIYSGPTPISTLVVIPLFIKMYREFILYKEKK